MPFLEYIIRCDTAGSYLLENETFGPMSQSAIYIWRIEPPIHPADDGGVGVSGIVIERSLLFQARQLVQSLDHLPLHVEEDWGVYLRLQLFAGRPFTLPRSFTLGIRLSDG